MLSQIYNGGNEDYKEGRVRCKEALSPYLEELHWRALTKIGGAVSHSPNKGWGCVAKYTTVNIFYFPLP